MCRRDLKRQIYGSPEKIPIMAQIKHINNKGVLRGIGATNDYPIIRIQQLEFPGSIH